MGVIEALTEEEMCLVAILQDESGLDQAEFFWHSPEEDDGCWRAWAFQWSWFRCNAPLQIDQSARSVGKALDVSTPVPTPAGWTTMGELRIGDTVIGADGRPTSVLEAFDVQHGRPCFEVVFDDGSTVVADVEHLWITQSEAVGQARGPEFSTGVRTTGEIGDTLRHNDQANHRVDLTEPIELPEQALGVSPYLLGYWLGLSGENEGPIPAANLRASVTQRIELLQGLMDAGGNITKNGRCEITQKHERLAHQIYELLATLGKKPFLAKHPGRDGGVEAGVMYRVSWGAGRTVPRRIVDVRPVESRPVRCIAVDNESHLFLVGESMIPTHNSQSIALRAFAFPFLHPGQEMVITAPEKVHLDAITDKVETQLYSSRITREMLVGGRNGIKHAPFHANFANGSRIMGRIPQRDGKGVKGCVSTQQLIWTSKGYRQAGDVQVGDLVLTHNGRYQPVTGVFPDVNDCYEVRGQGSFPMVVSCDHRFMGAANQATPKQKRRFTDLYFEDVEALVEDQFYWATPTDFPTLHVPSCAAFTMDESFWWLVGRYLADGYTAPGRVVFCAPDHKMLMVQDAVQRLGVSAGRRQRDHSGADVLEVYASDLMIWLVEHFGRLAGGKRLPAFALGMPEAHRRQLLQGYLDGDGFYSHDKNRWEVATASKELAMAVQLLAQSLGYTVNATFVQPKVTQICGTALKTQPQVSWRLQIGHGHPEAIKGVLVGKVKSVVPVGKQPIVDIRVDGDHSYLSGTIMSHNIHPIWLELDEAQNYPAPGWTEIIETLKRGAVGAVWRAHGVTRGVRDEFYKFTQSDSGWVVHRHCAMSRPNWTDAERQEKIRAYGSKDHPDYRRNVLGLHGDATNPLFVLHRLMNCVDDDESSAYNLDEYCSVRINDEMLRDHGGDITAMLTFPGLHRGKQYLHHWIGMDVGYTIAPSEILVFGETKPVKSGGDSILKLLSRIHMERVGHNPQVDAIAWLCEFYRPRVFAMDSTGVGLPLFKDLQEDHLDIARQIRGYNFSGQILVGFDSTIDVDEYTGDLVKEAGIRRNVLEYSQDTLRDYVDNARLRLPWDRNLIAQFQGGTSSSRSGHDQYGRKRIFSTGEDHALDASRMAVLGHVQYHIEELLKKDRREPVLDQFVY